MSAVPGDLLKEYVQSQHFTSTAGIMNAMKKMTIAMADALLGVSHEAPDGMIRDDITSYRKETPWSGQGRFLQLCQLF